jgi:hypothetical protein
VTFETGKLPSLEIHVAQDGSDQDGDGSVGNPYGSIQFAVQQANPGTAVRIHSGTYPGGIYLDSVHGTAEAPIWVGGAPGESRPIIDGGSNAMHIVRPRYLVVHDLDARGGAQNGINCDDGGYLADPDSARYVIFRSLNVHDVGGDGNQDCLKLSGLDDYWVLDSNFARCGGGMSGSGIDHVGCHRGLIENCRFEEMSGNAIQCKGGSFEIDIRHNWMVDPGERGVNMGGSTGAQYFRPPLSEVTPNVEAREIRVEGNVIIGGTTALAFVGCVRCLAAHNTIIDPDNWILRILQETTSGPINQFLPCSDNTFVNNLVYFDRSAISTWINIGSDTEPDTFTFSHNLWYAHDDPGASEPNLPVVETSGLYGQDPALADPGGRDFDLTRDSPAAGSGITGGGTLDADMDGVCYGQPPSMGAYEVE